MENIKQCASKHNWLYVQIKHVKNINMVKSLAANLVKKMCPHRFFESWFVRNEFNCTILNKFEFR